MDNIQTIEFVVTSMIVVSAAVWAVAAIKSTTATLKSEIANLAKSIDRLDRVLGTLAKDHDLLETRVTKLEMTLEHMQSKTPIATK
tara:strand:+ start:1149 stop:1406 length:258 start_codon:yes stop_codon:yes gene_type:complete